MRIIGLSDVHSNLSMIQRMAPILAAADVVLLAGDITHFGRETEIATLLDTLTPLAQKIFAVPGNCDYSGVGRYLDSEKINLHGKGQVFNNIGFVGLGGSLITPFSTPNELTENEIGSFLEQGAARIPPGIPMVLVSHQPPVKTRCDRIASGAHVGSLAVRHFIEKHQPILCFTGHIHEARDVDRIGKTRIINPGKLSRGYYAYAAISESAAETEILKIP